MTLAEVQAEIDRLNALKRQLEQEERETHKEQARQFVGKCYKNTNGTFFKIISIPIETWDAFRSIYNPRHFPALFLRWPEALEESYYKTDQLLDEFTPFYCDTVYLDVTKGIPGTAVWSCEEITSEEFDAEFDKCIAYYKELIK
jgi:hypothetical protein